MKTRIRLSALVALALVVVAARPLFAQVEVGVGVKLGKTEVNVAVDTDDEDEGPEITVESFLEPLEPYGRWIETIRYGWVWHPEQMPSDWRPYSYGHWECTEMGWMFVAEHPWGWACYHYGRWLDTPDNGWIWIPGTVWAPAWVSWRVGGEHIGWAPLPPDPHYHHASTVIVEERHVQLDFVFVRGSHFCEPARPAVFVPRAQHVNIVNQTTNITQVNVVNKTVINNGPQIKHVEKYVNKPVNIVKVKDVQKTEINNYHNDVAKTAPAKAEKLTRATETVEKNTNARVNKVQKSSPEVQERAARAVPTKGDDDDDRESGRRGRRDSGRDSDHDASRSEKAGDTKDTVEPHGRNSKRAGVTPTPENRNDSSNPSAKQPTPKQPVVRDAKRDGPKGRGDNPTDASNNPPNPLDSAKRTNDKSKAGKSTEDQARKPTDTSKSGRMPMPSRDATQIGKKDPRRSGTGDDEPKKKDKDKDKDKEKDKKKSHEGFLLPR